VNKLSNRKLIVLSIVGVVLAAVVYFMFNPATANFFPPCLFYKLTGYQCAGCGSQRAIHSLLHFDIVSAFKYNLIVVPAILLIALLIYLEHFGGKKRFPKLHRKLSSTKFIVAIIIVIVAYWLLRNIV